jgi:polyhydroxyalkanoic acid synthase PhaR subunit
MWKDMYEHTEKAWNDVIQDTLGKEVFSEGLGQVQSSYLQYHEMISNLTEAYFKQANIPTREEVANVASLVINLEDKIDNIDDQLYENSETISKEINQLKRTVGNLEKKFDKVLEAIVTLEKKIEAGERSTPAKPDDTNTK